MSKYGKLRKHQKDMLRIAEDIINGLVRDKIITADVVPGGGKTMLAAIAANELLDAGIVGQVIVVVPRDSLRMQIRDSFTCPERGMLRRIEAEGNKSLEQERLFAKSGYVTTYQAVAANPKRHLRRMKKVATLLILDEPHHISAFGESKWREAVEPLVREARFVLLMSGTLYRQDKTPIAFVRYTDDGLPIKDIEYSRRDGLNERAILPIDVQFCDGDAKYWYGRQEHTKKLSLARGNHEVQARRTLLWAPEYRDKIMFDALADWTAYREAHGHKSKAIVICADQKTARNCAAAIRRQMPGVRAILAISDEKDSVRNIERFRHGVDGDVLVTCQMAYEGLDVPSATHLVYLHVIRSDPWMDQALNRVTRPDPASPIPVDEQCAFVYVPNDDTIKTFIDKALDDQSEPCDLNPPEASGEGLIKRRSDFKPISGIESGIPERGRVASDGAGVISKGQSAIIAHMLERYPRLRGVVPAATILEIANDGNFWKLA